MVLNAAIRDFCADLRLDGRALATTRKHNQVLRRLERWCAAGDLDWQQLTKKQLKAYAREVVAEKGHSTRANSFTTWRLFFGWCVGEGYVLESPAGEFKTPRRPAPLPKSLTLEQVEQLASYLRACEGRTARRDEAMLLTALYAGLRACELARLRWSDVDLQGELINITLSKMNHGRAVPLHPKLGPALTSWRELQEPAGDWPCFSLDGRQLVAARSGKIARLASAGSGVRFTTHILRHTFATWTLRQSRDLYSVSKALGHAEIKQTEIYVS
ncbi:tyrosine-type recombinase/integrase, partial [Klebsiella pneumoniae]|uniref:tyrosine-type recombinase/integrase n=1 Tax=Klebsiella pneumoniae TaxID=573 RepID=UPI00191FCF29